MMGKISNQMRRKWRRRIDYLIERQEDMNDWERGFVDDMDKRLSEEKDLTIGQAYKLGEIFKEIDEGVGIYK